MMNNILIVLFSLLLSGFFSGMEIAFITANKLRFEIDKKNKSISSVFLSLPFKNPQQFISTILVGNNIALVVFGLKVAILLEQPLSEIYSSDIFITISQTIISTVIVLFTGEFIPKTIFRINPNLWLKIFAIPLWLCYIILYPISMITTWISIFILRIIGVKNTNSNENGGLNRTDLDFWVQESIDNIAENEEIEHEVKIFQNALDFSSVKVKDCMVPRTEMAALEEATDLDSLKNKFIETGFSKIIIYKENIDNVIGYVHSSEMFSNANNWRDNIQNSTIVPETMPANKMLQILMQQKKSMAVVVDEFGGTAGIITLEDIMEEIFGEIEDEHDNKKLISKKISDNEYILSGRQEISAVNQEFDLDIPESENYQTIAGFILNHYQDFPKVNENINIDTFHIRIIKVTNNKIELVNLKIED